MTEQTKINISSFLFAMIESAKQLIGVFPQETALAPNLSAEENRLVAFAITAAVFCFLRQMKK